MVRKAIKEDLDQIQTFLKEFHADITDNKFTSYFVCEKDSKIVGMLECAMIYERAEINYIYVDLNYRNQHVATDMLKLFFTECKYKNIENITLEVSEKNVSALYLYHKNGFVEVARRKHYYKDGDAILMERSLVVK